MKNLQKDMQAFVSARKWAKHHTARNLILALQEELGELAREFVWADTPEKIGTLMSTRKTEVSHEMADVLAYLISLANCLDIDLEDAFKEKMKINEQRFLVDDTDPREK